MDPVEERLQALEVTIAHLQRMCDQLNEVLTQQALESDQSLRRITQLEGIVKDLKAKQSDGPSIDPLDEKPPHY